VKRGGAAPGRALAGSAGEAHNPGMTHNDTPSFVALNGNDDFVTAADSLPELLAELQGEVEDIAVWRDRELVAARVHGRLLCFDGTGPESNGVPPETTIPLPDAPGAASGFGAAAGPRGGRPQLPFSVKPASLARLLGSWNWDAGRAKAVLARLGVAMTAEALTQELDAGRAGKGRLPRLGARELRALRQALARAGGG
jgi:hypothetical protein